MTIPPLHPYYSEVKEQAVASATAVLDEIHAKIAQSFVELDNAKAKVAQSLVELKNAKAKVDQFNQKRDEIIKIAKLDRHCLRKETTIDMISDSRSSTR